MRALVVANCQTKLMHAAFGALSPDVEWNSSTVNGLRRFFNYSDINGDGYDLLFLSPNAKTFFAHEKTRTIVVPGLYFRGFHPDMAALLNGRHPLPSPVGDYHSLIAVAAFLRGMSVQATLDLYRTETYEALGMFDVWGHSQTNMQRQYDAHGLDIGNCFPRWTRSGIFMYTPNHPRVNVMLDVVRGALAEAGMAAVTGVDNQVIDYYHEQTILPVYPEIAERFGLVGGTYWKRHKVEKLISHDRFVFDSFEMYSTMDREKLLTNQVSPILKSPVFS